MIIHNPFIRLYNHYNLYMGNYITHQFHLNVDIPYITGDRKPYIAGTMGTMSTMICLSMNNPRMFCLLYIYILYTETYLCIIYIYVYIYVYLCIHTYIYIYTCNVHKYTAHKVAPQVTSWFTIPIEIH